MSIARLPVVALFAACGMVSIAQAENVTFDFDDDGAPIVNGQMLESPNAFGTVFDIVSIGPNLGAAAFDSDPFGPNMNSLDQDLLLDMGNILILQSPDFPGSSGSVFEIPNDANDGGAITFDFSPAGFAVGVESIDVIDLDVGDVTMTLTDGMGRTRMVTIPSAYTGDITEGAPGVATIDFTGGAQESPNIAGLFTEVFVEAGFNGSDVVSLLIDAPQSGAFDNLSFVPEPTTGLLLLLGCAAAIRRRR